MNVQFQIIHISECITCDLETQRGNECKYNSIKMSTNAQFYVHSCLGPDIPEVVLRSVQDDHQVKYIFELNEDLETQLQNKAVSERMDITLTVGGEGGLAEYQAPVVMRLPRGYDPAKKYPVQFLQIDFFLLKFGFTKVSHYSYCCTFMEVQVHKM